MSRHRNHSESGQALVEFTFFAMILLVLLFGMIDLGRAIYYRMILTSVSREAANLASRGIDFTNTVIAAQISAQPLDLKNNGCVILTRIRRSTDGSTTEIVDLYPKNPSPPSKINAGSGGTTLPTAGRSLYVAEVYYQYQSVTPLGMLLQMVLPDWVYDVAFF